MAAVMAVTRATNVGKIILPIKIIVSEAYLLRSFLIPRYQG